MPLTFTTDDFADTKAAEPLTFSESDFEEPSGESTFKKVSKAVGRPFTESGEFLSSLSKAAALTAVGEPGLAKQELQSFAENQLPPAAQQGLETAGMRDTSPYEEGRKSLPVVERAAAGLGPGLIGSAPQLAATMVAGPVGAATFGFNKEGFDPVQAATAMIAPMAGKFLGNVAAKVAAKAGISSDQAMALIDRVGGAAGVAGIMSAPSVAQIASMEPGEARDQAIEDTAANALLMGVLGGSGERSAAAPARKSTVPIAKAVATEINQAGPSFNGETPPKPVVEFAEPRPKIGFTVEDFAPAGQPEPPKEPEAPAAVPPPPAPPVSAPGEVKPAETPPEAPAGKLTLTPALLVDGKPVIISPENKEKPPYFNTHAGIMMDVATDPNATESEVDAILNAHDDPAAHVFVEVDDKGNIVGKPLNRKEAWKKSGRPGEGELQSQDLLADKARAPAPPAAPAPAVKPPEPISPGAAADKFGKVEIKTTGSVSRVRYFDKSGNEIGYGQLDGDVINYVSVEPKYQRQGFGSEIVKDLKQRGGKIGVAGTPEGTALMRSKKVGANEYEPNKFNFESPSIPAKETGKPAAPAAVQKVAEPKTDEDIAQNAVAEGKPLDAKFVADNGYEKQLTEAGYVLNGDKWEKSGDISSGKPGPGPGTGAGPGSPHVSEMGQGGDETAGYGGDIYGEARAKAGQMRADGKSKLSVSRALYDGGLSAGDASAIADQTFSKAAEAVPSKQTFRSKADRLAAKLESLKSGVKAGGKQLHIFGLGADLWDRGVAVAQAILKAGGSVADAIDAFIKHVKENSAQMFDEKGAREHLRAALTEEEAGPGVGIRHETRQAHAEAAGLPDVQRGKVRTKEEMLNTAREQLAATDDPEIVVADAFKVLQASDNSQARATLRAENERLRRVANNAYNAARENFLKGRTTTRPEDDPAVKAAEQKIAEFNTEYDKTTAQWAAEGHIMQDETDINTGEFLELKRAYEEENPGKKLSPVKTAEGQKVADTVKKKEGEVKQSQDDLIKNVDAAHKLDAADESDTGKFSSALDKLAYQILSENPNFTPDQLSKELHARVSEIAPDLSEDDIQRALSKYGQSRQMTTDDTRMKLFDYKRQYQERLKQKSMASGQPPEKTGMVRPQASADLRAEMKRTAEAKRKGGFNVTDPEKQLRAALEASKTRVRHHIEDLEKEIANRERAVRRRTGTPNDTELERLKKDLAAIRDRHAQVFGEVDVEELKNRLAAKTTPDFTDAESKEIWQMAKARYLLKGETDFDKIRYGLANDLGLTPEQVARALGKKPEVKKMLDEIWRKQADLRGLRVKAQLWVKLSDSPKAWNLIKSLPDRYFGLKVFGHGLVWMGTHTPLLVLDPLTLPLVLTHYARGAKNLFSKAYWQRYTSDIANHPNYNFWLHRRLAIAIDRPVGEYAEASVNFGKLGISGNRAFDAMKGLRLDMAEKLWNAAGKKGIQNEALAADIVDMVNHLSGALTGGGEKTGKFVSVLGSRGARTLSMAPKLYASRYAALYDTPKALTGFKPGATPQERFMATTAATHLAALAGLWATTMAVNQAILSMSGSNQKINVTDPSKSDFMSYKIGGYNVGIASGTVGIFRFFGRLYQSLRKPVIYEPPSSVMMEYGRQMASPALGLGVDVASGENLFGRPLPPVVQKARGLIGLAPAKATKGHPQLGNIEYFGQQFSPIPASEALQNFYKELENGGFTANEAKSLAKSAATAIASGATGFRITEPYNAPKKNAMRE